MTGLASPRQAGFTLVEMLVALAIFALLAGAGVGLLRSSVDTQAAVDQRLAALGSFGRLHALLATDLGQAVERSSFAGQPASSFTGNPGGFEILRTGWTNLGEAPRSNLQRVTWRALDDGLHRTGSERLGRGAPGIDARLGRGIGRGSFRYRLVDGSWAAVFRSTEQQALPTAVEVTFGSPSGPVIVVLALPPQAPKPV